MPSVNELIAHNKVANDQIAKEIGRCGYLPVTLT